MPVDMYVALCRALTRTACCKKCVVQTGNGGLHLEIQCKTHSTNIVINITLNPPATETKEVANGLPNDIAD